MLVSLESDAEPITPTTETRPIVQQSYGQSTYAQHLYDANMNVHTNRTSLSNNLPSMIDKTKFNCLRSDCGNLKHSITVSNHGNISISEIELEPKLEGTTPT